MPAPFAYLLASRPTFSFALTASATGIDFRAQAVAAGWNQYDYVMGTLAASSTANTGGTSVDGTNALTIAGSFPSKGRLVINGAVVVTAGAGGTGSVGTNAAAGAGGATDEPGSPGGAPGNGGNGANGGTALTCSVAGFEVDNQGTITAGGAGPGGAAGARSGGGGGGGETIDDGVHAPKPGGVGGNGYSVAGGGPFGGAPGQLAFGVGWSGKGGDGGAIASAGTAGYRPGANDTVGGLSTFDLGGAAGAAASAGTSGSVGNAVAGNANIVWINTGTRNGAIT